jgi:hypothetical protein
MVEINEGDGTLKRHVRMVLVIWGRASRISNSSTVFGGSLVDVGPGQCCSAAGIDVC